MMQDEKRILFLRAPPFSLTLCSLCVNFSSEADVRVPCFSLFYNNQPLLGLKALGAPRCPQRPQQWQRSLPPLAWRLPAQLVYRETIGRQSRASSAAVTMAAAVVPVAIVVVIVATAVQRTAASTKKVATAATVAAPASAVAAATAATAVIPVTYGCQRAPSLL